MNGARIFLALVGVIYVALALWCALKPQTTAGSIGFQLKPGAGESEYTTVYGGLQLALGLLFLWPMMRSEMLWPMLVACLVVHTSLVVFRTVSLMLYANIPAMTYGFAASEWVVALLAGWFVINQK